MTSRWRPNVAFALSLIGFGLAAWLTYGHYFDQKAIDTTCPLGGTSSLVSCAAVTTSSWSVIFGIPVALYGLAFFAAMLVLNLPRAWRSASPLIAKGRLWLNVAGMGFVLYLVGVEFLAVHHICLYCTFVHLTQFILFLVVVTGWYDTGYAASLDQDEGADAARGSLVA